MNSEESTKILEKIGAYLSSLPTSDWKEICVEAEIDDSMADLCPKEQGHPSFATYRNSRRGLY